MHSVPLDAYTGVLALFGFVFILLFPWLERWTLWSSWRRDRGVLKELLPAGHPSRRRPQGNSRRELQGQGLHTCHLQLPSWPRKTQVSRPCTLALGAVLCLANSDSHVRVWRWQARCGNHGPLLCPILSIFRGSNGPSKGRKLVLAERGEKILDVTVVCGPPNSTLLDKISFF